jgi:hypothetical protein
MVFRGVWRLLGAAAAASLLVCGSAEAVTFNWSGQFPIDGGPPLALAGHQNLRAVSCPSAQLCVAIDQSGYVFTSNAPLSTTGSWRRAGTVKGQVNALDCPSTQLCVAVTQGGDALLSTNPTTSALAWKRSHVASRLVSLSCPTAGFCAAVDGARGVYTSQGAARWRQTAFGTGKVSRGGGLTAVACASARFCVAVSNAGDVLSSRNPAGPAKAWRRIVLARTHLTGAACPSSQLCVLLDGKAHALISSTNPTGGIRAWRRGVINSGNRTLGALSCQSTALCLVGDSIGDVFSSTSPAGGARAWRNTASLPLPVVSFACASSTFCAAVDGNNALATSAPTGSAWSLVSIDDAGGTSIDGVSCPTVQLCVAVDAAGTVLTSTTPGTQGLWTSQAADGGALVGVSCAGISLCVAVDGSSGAFSSTNPTGGLAAWSRVAIDPGHQLTAVACPSAQLCVATDDAGRVLSTTTPTGGAGAWRAAKIDKSALTGIACSSPSVCVAAGVGSRILASTNPSGGPSTWRVVATDGNSGNVWTDTAPSPSMSVACAPQGLCVAGDANGGLMSSISPARGSWHLAVIDPNTGPDIIVSYYPLAAVSCASNQLCVALANSSTDEPSEALMSSNPTDGGSWSATDIDDDDYVSAVSCPSTQLCVVGNQSAEAIIGTGQ